MRAPVAGAVLLSGRSWLAASTRLSQEDKVPRDVAFAASALARHLLRKNDGNVAFLCQLSLTDLFIFCAVWGGFRAAQHSNYGARWVNAHSW